MGAIRMSIAVASITSAIFFTADQIFKAMPGVRQREPDTLYRVFVRVC